jgi:ATP-binding cassette subfamily B protein
MIAGSITSRLNEVITGIFVVRGMGQEDKERSIFYKNIGDYKQNTIAQGSVMARYYPLLFFGIATVFSLFHATILLNEGKIDIGQLISYIGLIQLLRFPTFINIFALTVLTMGVQSAKRILQIINWESLIDLNSSGYAEPINGNVDFENVTFGYSPAKTVIKNVSFSVKPGQTIALVGMTGSGKTTVTKLLTRLYEPQHGIITIDGINIKDWSINSLRSQIAIVEQDVFLFSKSIRNNIAFGSQASMDDIIDSAKKAQAHDFIMDLPEQYETVIGERGFTLSGGQRQRIAIARAILRNPKILILDDASSAIDSRTEDEIQTAIKTVLQNRVSFLITHRLAQIRRADKIILMDKGEILSIGSHNELLKTSKVYKSIFSSFDEFEKVYGQIGEVEPILGD